MIVSSTRSSEVPTEFGRRLAIFRRHLRIRTGLSATMQCESSRHDLHGDVPPTCARWRRTRRARCSRASTCFTSESRGNSNGGERPDSNITCADAVGAGCSGSAGEGGGGRLEGRGGVGRRGVGAAWAVLGAGFGTVGLLV